MFKIQFAIKSIYNNLIILSHQLQNDKKGGNRRTSNINVYFKV
jgi:hypothetical protein